VKFDLPLPKFAKQTHPGQTQSNQGSRFDSKKETAGSH
jgi:hypothetical protein